MHAVTRKFSLLTLLVVGACGQTRADIAFTNVTASAGPFHTGESWGAAWGHFNSDEYPDLLVTNHRSPEGLYRNRGGVDFVDIAASVDVDGVWNSPTNHDTHSASWADFDNDGDQDLVQLTGGTGTKNFFMVNEDGLLYEESDAYSVPSLNSGRMATWFDYQGDGRLDLLLLSRGAGAVMLRQGATSFVDVSAAAGVDCGKVDYGFLSDVKLTDDVTDDGRLELLCAWQTEFPQDVYEIPDFPLPGFPFDDVTAEFTSSFPAVTRSKDVAVGDFNGDLRPDMFVIRGGMRPSQALQAGTNGLEAYMQDPGQQVVTFTSAGDVSFKVDSNDLTAAEIFIGSSGTHPADLNFTLDSADPGVVGIKTHNPDTDKGLYIGFDSAAKKWTVANSSGGLRLLTYLQASSTSSVSNVVMTGLLANDRPTQPNLLMSVPDSIPTDYQETSVASGFGTNMCISAAAGDFDNDMDVDLYLVCRGGVENQPNRLFENLGTGTFREVTGGGGAQGVLGLAVTDEAGLGESVAMADYNVDGFLDLFVTNGLSLQPEGMGGPDQLFRNSGNGNQWIELDLVGTVSNRDAVGARVFATTGAKTQVRWQDGGYHRWTQHHQRLHFGLGSRSLVDLHVEWPSGQVDDFTDVSTSHLYRITEGEASGDGRITLVGGASRTVNVAALSVDEGAGSATVRVTLSEPSDSPITVKYDTSKGTALTPADFGDVTGTLTFAPGDTVKTFAVTIEDDTEIEGSETFNVTLSNPVGAAAGVMNAAVTIKDNDSVACGKPTYNPATTAGLYLWRNCDYTGAGQQWFLRSTGGGSGTNLRYEGSLSSADAFTATPFALEATDVLDTSKVGIAKFTFLLKGSTQDGMDLMLPAGANACLATTLLPTGAKVRVGSTGRVVTAPFDLAGLAACDPPAGPTLRILDASVSESQASVPVTIRLAEAAAVRTTVAYQTSNGTATAGADYRAKTNRAVIAVGQTQVTVPISLLSDTRVEGDETFNITLSSPVNAVIGRATATVTIVDDD